MDEGGHSACALRLHGREWPGAGLGVRASAAGATGLARVARGGFIAICAADGPTGRGPAACAPLSYILRLPTGARVTMAVERHSSRDTADVVAWP